MSYSFARAQRRREVRQEARSHKEQLPAYIDLVDWIKLRSRLSTRRALSVIMAGALRSDSHTLGRKQMKRIDGSTFNAIDRFVPADLRGRIEIHTPEGL